MARRKLVLSPAEWVPLKYALERIKAHVGSGLAKHRLSQHLCDGSLPSAQDDRSEQRLMRPKEWQDDPAMLGRMLFVAMPPAYGFVRRRDLDKLYPVGTGPSAASAPERRRGPATTHDWFAICGKIARCCIDNTGRVAVPKNESKLADEVATWCGETLGKEPAISELREAVKRICAALRAAKI